MYVEFVGKDVRTDGPATCPSLRAYPQEDTPGFVNPLCFVLPRSSKPDGDCAGCSQRARERGPMDAGICCLPGVPRTGDIGMANSPGAPSKPAAIADIPEAKPVASLSANRGVLLAIPTPH